MLRLGIYPTCLVSLFVHYHQADRRRPKTFYPSPNISPPVLKLCASIKIKIFMGTFVLIIHHKNIHFPFFITHFADNYPYHCLLPANIQRYHVVAQGVNKSNTIYFIFYIICPLPETRRLLSKEVGIQETTKVYKQCQSVVLQFHS